MPAQVAALLRGALYAELAGALSNPEVATRLARLVEALGAPKAGRIDKAAPSKPAQGQVLRAIKAVLAAESEGLRTVDVWRLVQARLDRPVSYSAVKTDLADNVGPDRCFVRVRRGVYRLAAA